MNAASLATVALAGFALLGIIFGGIAWFYRRGGQERELIIAVQNNSKALDGLTARMDQFLERYEALGKRVDGHELRLAISEETVRSAGRDISDLQRREWTRHPAQVEGK